MTKSRNIGRGGRRDKAGARPGNPNASKNLRSSRFAWLRYWAELNPESHGRAVARRLKDRDAQCTGLVELVKRRDPDAWRELTQLAGQWALEEDGLSRLVPADNDQREPDNNQRGDPTRLYISTPPPPAHQSKGRPVQLSIVGGSAELLDETVRRVAEWGYRGGARLWVRMHDEWLADVVELLDALDEMSAAELYDITPIRWLIGTLHTRMGVEVTDDAGAAVICPMAPKCKWTREGKQLEMPVAK